MGSEALLVLTTCANREEADELASALVQRRLAACVNRLGVVSTYRWESRVQHDEETLLVIKTTEARFDALQKTIQERTSYELPELIAVPVCNGSRAYLDWLETLRDQTYISRKGLYAESSRARVPSEMLQRP